MKQIHIKANDFFELLKGKEQSMWDIFSQLIKDDQEQEIIFLDNNNKVLFNYILPNNLEKLKVDQTKFAEEFKSKLKSF